VIRPVLNNLVFKNRSPDKLGPPREVGRFPFVQQERK
jgi:hypothetical protein